MPATVTIDRVLYRISKLESGNLLIEHESAQVTPMQGPGTGGLHSFEVHPVQSHQYQFWAQHLPEDERQQGGPGKDGADPPWSLRKARTDTSTESTESMLTKGRGRK